MTPRPIRRKKPVTFIEEIARGEITLEQGRGKFLFPTNSNTHHILCKLKPVEDPNAYPNCIIPGHCDEAKMARTPSGFEISYRVDSSSRILEWIVSKPSSS